jgi:hypothetical protein
VLLGDLAINLLPHLSIGPEFPVAARVARMIDAAMPHRRIRRCLGHRMAHQGEFNRQLALQLQVEAADFREAVNRLLAMPSSSLRGAKAS